MTSNVNFDAGPFFVIFLLSGWLTAQKAIIKKKKKEKKFSNQSSIEVNTFAVIATILSAQKAPQKAGLYTYTMSLWEHPRDLASTWQVIL